MLCSSAGRRRELRDERRSSKATDLLIIATASATGRTLLTLDDAQASLARVAGVAVNP